MNQAKILDGKQIAQAIVQELNHRIKRLQQQNVQPCLAVILVGDDPASSIYVNKKAQTFIGLGLDSRLIKLPKETSMDQLLSQVQELNQDPMVHGILVQLPLPDHLNELKVIETINPEKDVDGFHRINCGALFIGKPQFIPCTPYGIMEILATVEDLEIRGSRTVIVGASNIVGKPIALLMQRAGATVTICNSKTKNLAKHTQEADILIVATGKPKMITADMVKAGAVVIDVGINYLPTGKLCGDVDFDNVKEKAAAITPVPGGVGPMTITMLLVNTIQAAEKLLQK